MRFELFQSSTKEWFWRLMFAKELLKESDRGFASKSDCLRAVATVRRDVVQAETVTI